MTLAHSYAPLPGYTDNANKNAHLPVEHAPAVRMRPAGPGAFPAGLGYQGPAAPPKWKANYEEGDTENYANYAYENYLAEVPNGSKDDNNTMIIAMSCAAGGLLLIIILMLFFVNPNKRR